MSQLRNFTKGLIKESPVFVLMLGLCPTLAVSTSIENAICMGLAMTFVLVSSNLIISIFRKSIPEAIRIPCFIVIIATFVVVVEQVLAGYEPQLSKRLGIYVPLIVVNCIILGRAEAFASKNSPLPSTIDGLGMGVGFTLSLILISVIREALGTGSLCGFTLLPGFKPLSIMLLPSGAFFTIGFLLGLFNLKK